MKWNLCLVLLAALACGALATCGMSSALAQPRDPAAAPAQDRPQQQRVRIGTYDSRAVAVAYARSEHFLGVVRALQEKHADAEKAGNKKLAKELAGQGESLQVRMHLQGFSTAPVDEILEQVRDRLPDIARQTNTVAIARSADFHDDSVELVDVTDQLVQLFNPDERTMKIIGELKSQKPLPIETVAKMPANE